MNNPNTEVQHPPPDCATEGSLSGETDTSSAYAVRVGKLSPAEWSGLLCQFDDTSLYQTSAYGTVRWGDNQLEHILLMKDGQIAAMAQLRVVQFAALKAGVAYLRWGPLLRLKGQPTNLETARRMFRTLKQEYVERRGLVLRILPHVFEGQPSATVVRSASGEEGLSENPALPRYRTILVDLTKAPENLRRGFDQKWRNCLNAAEKKGLTVVQGTSIDLYDRFLEVYGQMMTRKQFETSVDVNEFRKLQQDLPEPLKMQTFLCEKDGKVVNALVLSAVGDTAIYLLGASSADGMNLKGAYLLQWRAIQWLKTRGCKWYDLGGINPERNPGVYHFKSGLGGKEVYQLGTFELSGSWTSTACIRLGEQMQSMRRVLRSGLKRAVGMARTESPQTKFL